MLTDNNFIYSGQGKTQRNAGWDFSIGGSAGSTGTVRSAVRPPQIRDRKPDIQGTQKRNVETGTRRISETSRRDSRESDQDKKQDYYKGDEDISMDGTGTVVVRSPRAQTSSLFSDQSTMVGLKSVFFNLNNLLVFFNDLICFLIGVHCLFSRAAHLALLKMLQSVALLSTVDHMRTQILLALQSQDWEFKRKHQPLHMRIVP